MVASDEDALMASGVMGGEGATQAVAEVAKAKVGRGGGRGCGGGAVVTNVVCGGTRLAAACHMPHATCCMRHAARQMRTCATCACAPARAAQGKLVSAMMKKHLVEGVVPLLVELKHMLQVRPRARVRAPAPAHWAYLTHNSSVYELLVSFWLTPL